MSICQTEKLLSYQPAGRHANSINIQYTRRKKKIAQERNNLSIVRNDPEQEGKEKGMTSTRCVKLCIQITFSVYYLVLKSTQKIEVYDTSF